MRRLARALRPAGPAPDLEALFRQLDELDAGKSAPTAPGAAGPTLAQPLLPAATAAVAAGVPPDPGAGLDPSTTGLVNLLCAWSVGGG